jgi:hypothetical protein
MADENERGKYDLPREVELEKPVFLASVGDEMEAGVIRSLLESCGIPSRSRNVGVGAYLGVVLGTNRMGIEIDVAESDLEMARKILAANPLSDEAAQRMIDTGEFEEAGTALDEDGNFVDEDEDEGSDAIDESVVYESVVYADAAGVPEDEKKAPNFWLILLLLLVGVPLLAALLIRLLRMFL